MGTVVERSKTAFRAVVRLRGEKPKTKTFPTKTEAQNWIIKTEAAIITAAPRPKRGTHTLGWVLERVRLRELEKKYKASGASVFARFSKEIGHVDLADCTAEFWKKTIMGWDVSPYSRLTNVSRIKGALSTAEALWSVTVDWEALRLATAALTKVGEMKKGKARVRRVADSELTAIKAWVAGEYTGKMPIADVVDFAVITCMRQAEIFRVTWDDLNTIDGYPMLWIRDRKDPKEKIGNDQNIPLLGKAMAIIKRQPKRRLADGSLDPRIFPFNAGTFCNYFTVASEGAKVKGLHFHDLRHEGISRMFDAGYAIEEVCKVSGHKSWETLRIYTHTAGERLHQGPIAHAANRLRAVA
jgi:integrase